MKNLFKFFGIISLIVVIGFSIISCGDGAGGGGEAGDYTVTINNIHSSYNGDSAYNSFLLLDPTSYDAAGPDSNYTVQNGKITGIFGYRDRMANWDSMEVWINLDDQGPFISTNKYPVSQKNIVIDAQNMVWHGGKKLSDPK